jgi:exopolysaccharide/PEP-CTERM locus tyrosine autokinase
MSLVEQAARRLEELRKAGVPASGDVTRGEAAREAAPAVAVESTIERAARKLESLELHRGTVELRRPAAAPAEPSPAALQPADVAPAPPPLNDALPLWGERARHEPHLDRALPLEMLDPAAAPARTPAPAGAVEARAPAEAAEPPPALELDLQRLASAGVLTPDRIDSALANQLRFIKRPLINAAQGKGPRPLANANRIMVSSALPGEGKSFIALNIAMSIAMERDSRVLLVDADTTRPSLSAMLGAPLAEGLLDLLTNPALSPRQTLLRTNLERLTFLPSGTPRANATELLASEAMARLVAHLAGRYSDRILIFDAPPLLAATEPSVLASHMGQVVLVVEARRTTHKAVQQALAAVEACPVVMTVLNKCDGNGGLREYAPRNAA